MEKLFTALLGCILLTTLNAQPPQDNDRIRMDNRHLFMGPNDIEPKARLHITHVDLDQDNSPGLTPAAHIGDYFGDIFIYGYLTVDQPESDLNTNIARFRDNGIGQVWINRASFDYQLRIRGDALAEGGVWVNSDRKLKKDLKSLGNTLADLRQLKPYTYFFKPTSDPRIHIPKEQQFGLVAQDLEAVYPNLVRESMQMQEERGKGQQIKSVNYIGLIPVIIAALQELDQEVMVKDSEIRTLKREIAVQQSQIDELKSMMERLLAQQSESETIDGSLHLEQKARLSQNFPNPFHENTLITYYLPEDTGNARLEIHAIDGRLLETIPLPQTEKGQVKIEAGRFSPGTYLYSLIVDNVALETKRMVFTE